MIKKSTFVTSRSALAFSVYLITALVNYGIEIGIPDTVLLFAGALGMSFVVGNKLEDIVRNIYSVSKEPVKEFIENEAQDIAISVLNIVTEKLNENVPEEYRIELDKKE